MSVATFICDGLSLPFLRYQPKAKKNIIFMLTKHFLTFVFESYFIFEKSRYTQFSFCMAF